MARYCSYYDRRHNRPINLDNTHSFINMKDFLIKMITSHSGVSSKRVCGILGFLIIIVVLLYCTITHTQAPVMIEPFTYVVCLLLGIDSVMSPFYQKYKKA